MIEAISIGLPVICILLSISGFNGGFHFGTFKLLKKLKRLNDLIVQKGDNELLYELNEFLIAINVKNHKPSFSEWIFRSFNRENHL